LQTQLMSVSDAGVEVLASARLIETSLVGWRASLTATTLSSRITGTTSPAYPNAPYQVGHSPQGVWAGSYTWADANGDGYIGTDEVSQGGSSSYLGPSTPTVEVGLRNTFTLPGSLSLSTLLDHRGGHYRENATETRRCSAGVCLSRNDLSLPLAEQARWVAVLRRYATNAEPASFTRLREVVLEWSPGAGDRVAGVRRLGVRLVGQNLATWTRYSGIDPEVGTMQWHGRNSVTDLFQGPLPRRVSLELRVGTGGAAP
jgi:hypothetical protein